MSTWKKAALLALLAAVALLAAPAPELSVPPPDTASPVVAPLTPAALAQPSPPVIPFCGDPCWTPGQERGCIDDSQGVWRRVFCTCSGGSWQCW